MCGEVLPIFHPLIEADVREGMAHYDWQSPGLGSRFRRTFYAAVDDLLVYLLSVQYAGRNPVFLASVARQRRSP